MEISLFESFAGNNVNAVVSMGFRTLLENVDETNRLYEMNYLFRVFAKPIEYSYPNACWILHGHTSFHAMGYIAVTQRDTDRFEITGMYMDPILRRSGFMKKLLHCATAHLQAYKAEKQLNELKMEAAVAHYSKEALSFFQTMQFDLMSMEHENDNHLHIAHFTKIL